MPQAFSGHLFVQDALTLMHHEESFVTMHNDVSVGLDCRSSCLNEEASLARGNPHRAESSKDGGPHFVKSQVLRTEWHLRLLLLLFDFLVAGDQRAKSSCKLLLRPSQILRRVEVRYRGGTHGHSKTAEELKACSCR